MLTFAVMTIDELEAFFKGRELPKVAQINRAIRISDVEFFLKGSIERVRLFGTEIPSYWRLIEFRDWLLQQEENTDIKD